MRTLLHYGDVGATPSTQPVRAVSTCSATVKRGARHNGETMSKSSARCSLAPWLGVALIVILFDQLPRSRSRRCLPTVFA